MFEVKSIAEVLGLIKENFTSGRLETETVKIREALNRITACAITAREDLPGFNRSTVDGYAVIAADTFGSGESLPAQLKLIGEVQMGGKASLIINTGQTAYTPTGGALPENTDAVVMIEYAEDLDDGFVYLYKPVAPGNNVIFRGDDLRVGEVVLNANQRLRPQEIGVLAALGIAEVTVKKKIRVGIIATGDEVVEAGKKPTGSEIRDVNSDLLYAGLAEYGAVPVLYGIVSDHFEKLKETLESALPECDVLLISGGSSVGARDVTAQVISSLESSSILAHGIAIKPGKPTIIGKTGSKAVLGLPGHPASAFFVFKLIVTGLLDAMNGITRQPVGTVKGKMVVNYPSNNGREEYVPVMIRDHDGERLVQPVFGKSGLIKLLTSADGYVRIERGSEGINKGHEVEVILF